MRRARQHGFAREFRAVQKEEQPDRYIGQRVDGECDVPLARQQAREHDGADEREREIIGNHERQARHERAC